MEYISSIYSNYAHGNRMGLIRTHVHRELTEAWQDSKLYGINVSKLDLQKGLFPNNYFDLLR